MTTAEKRVLKDTLATWYGACCGPRRAQSAPLCSPGERVRCARILDVLGALIDRARPGGNGASRRCV